MINNKTSIFIFVVLFILIMYTCLIIAEDINISLETNASLCLNNSKIILSQLINDGFSYQRVNDSLKQLETDYNIQMILKEKKNKYDFSRVIAECEDINRIKDLAYSSKDELNALNKFYNESVSGLNTSQIDQIISEAKREMINERYEKIEDIVQRAYNEITNAQASQTTLNLFYSATTRGIKNFLNKNWKFLLAILIILIIAFIIYKKTIFVYILRKKMVKLELRKETIKKIMMKTQKDYFQLGIISEGEFAIKMNKLGELVRDIERQIPLLNEELAKINKVKQ